MFDWANGVRRAQADGSGGVEGGRWYIAQSRRAVRTRDGDPGPGNRLARSCSRPPHVRAAQPAGSSLPVVFGVFSRPSILARDCARSFRLGWATRQGDGARAVNSRSRGRWRSRAIRALSRPAGASSQRTRRSSLVVHLWCPWNNVDAPAMAHREATARDAVTGRHRPHTGRSRMQRCARPQGRLTARRTGPCGKSLQRLIVERRIVTHHPQPERPDLRPARGP